MFGWTLLEAILGGDAEVVIGVSDDELPSGGAEGEDSEGEGPPPDNVA